MYVDVERVLKPVLMAHAHKLSRAIGMQVDDAIQEHRVALARAMSGYDYNRARGGLHKFADRVLRNNTLSLVYRYTTETRTPHTVCEVDGKHRVVKWRLSSLDDQTSDGAPLIPQPASNDQDPEARMLTEEAHVRRRKLLMRLLSKLSDRERLVFECKCRPDDAFMTYMRNIGADEPTHPIIAKYIGLDKNAVDYAAHHIRDKFTKLAEQEFPDLIEHHIADGTWPMIHHTAGASPDSEFAASVIKKRGLDPRPVAGRDVRVRGAWGLDCETYHWGVVLFLKNGVDCRTLVIEGRVNLASGGVFGKMDGTHKSIADLVPWYAKLVRGLKG
jgi:DNA-directed RNA polymerase specialized sigma24 family protein